MKIVLALVFFFGFLPCPPLRAELSNSIQDELIARSEQGNVPAKALLKKLNNVETWCLDSTKYNQNTCRFHSRQEVYTHAQSLASILDPMDRAIRKVRSYFHSKADPVAPLDQLSDADLIDNYLKNRLLEFRDHNQLSDCQAVCMAACTAGAMVKLVGRKTGGLPPHFKTMHAPPSYVMVDGNGSCYDRSHLIEHFVQSMGLSASTSKLDPDLLNGVKILGALEITSLAAVATGLYTNNEYLLAPGAALSALAPLTAALIGHRVNGVTLEGVRYVFDYGMGGYDEENNRVALREKSPGFDRKTFQCHFYEVE